MMGHLLTRDGMGGGNLMGTIRHAYSSSTWGEVSVALLRPKQIQMKIVKSLSPDRQVQY
jgi:DnaJ family protein C protein 11